MRKLIFPGCVISARYPQFEAATKLLLEKLGVEAVSLGGFSCCPEPSSMQLLDRTSWLVLAARNLSLAEEAGLDLVSLCSGCTKSLLSAWRELRSEEKRREVNRYLSAVGRSYKGGSRVESILRLLYEGVGVDRVKAAVEKPVEVRAATHLGCHIYEELPEYDDIKSPRALKELVSAAGAEPVSYEGEELCCAYYVWGADRELALEQARLKLSNALDAGAECMVVVCPTCFRQFELAQIGWSRRLPVLYLSQLLALAAGVPAEKLGFKYHMVEVKLGE
ncbi:MAG: CoB--CoM heterodisulfide reductase subunit B [Thermoproteota archaeon]|nr:MAG: CoB--CoM heterodisulfide reductase subunit B [Candidatus Korarchaeota archaeon]